MTLFTIKEEYMNKLCGMSLDDIKKEPTKHDQELHDLQSKVSQVTCSEYQSFLHAHNHLEELDRLLFEIPSRLEFIKSHIHPIETKLEKLVKTSTASTLTRSRLYVIVSQLDLLEPVLEIPMLFDTLIRNGYYEEAMDLQLYTQRLPIRYPNIPILSQIATMKSSFAMLNQLFSMLRGPCKLPLVVRVIGYLRRLHFDEEIIRVLFLCLRYEYLTTLTSIIKDPQGHEYTRRWIETHRETFFDIVTHYKAIFTRSTTQMSSTPTSSTLPKETPKEKDHFILSSFAGFVLLDLFTVVDQYLDTATEMTYFPSLNMQLMYYGVSLSRVGLDFRPFIVSRFEKAVIRIVNSWFDLATCSFYISNESKTERPTEEMKEEEMLCLYGPIALSYNYFLTGLNQLRYLPISSLHSRLCKSLLEKIGAMADIILKGQERYRRETEIVAWIFKDVLVPRVVQGLDSVLGHATSISSFHPGLERLDILVQGAKLGVGRRSSSVLVVEEDSKDEVFVAELDDAVPEPSTVSNQEDTSLS